jgi:acyl-homoserine-lactone acylase
MRLWYPILATTLAACSCSNRAEHVAGSEAAKRAQNVSILRDDWGIPHIHGKTDADAVFGLIYAQAEDDFNRIETNYLNAMGRLAEAEGESAIMRDLRMKLFIDPEDLKAKYRESPDWLKTLMNAWADGLNYYLAKNPAVTPRVIKQFEPWMALSFSEGSIGGDIERISLAALEAFYGKGPIERTPPPDAAFLPDKGGSNGIAIGPSKSASGHPLLLINPHTSFFFRAEVQVASDEGLNAYGAVTWGQFFVYQGFNDRAGWMHTSSGVDCIDEYSESVTKKDDGFYYRYDGADRKLTTKSITVPYKAGTGRESRTFTVYRSHHGPVVRMADQNWISVRLMEEPVKALTQSFSRTKAKNYRQFKEVMNLHTNSSNNTVFADHEGNIAYFHANFIPRRDPLLDWTKPVDGTTSTTEWQPVLSVDESPLVHNPSIGWIQNTNNWPFSAAGAESPRQADYPRYVETYVENPRGVHAVEVLDGKIGFTVESLTAAAFDNHLTAFEPLLRVLFADYDGTPDGDGLKAKLQEQVALLRAWDRRWAAASIPTTLAYFWGEELWRQATAKGDLGGLTTYDFIAQKLTPRERLEALATIAGKLEADFGTWQMPWGEMNRFQRITDDIVHPFDDAAPSLPVPFASGRWGSLASFAARPYNGSKKIYGTSGNSFVAVVEFGDKVRARAITAGGQSGNPASPHFADQAARYASGELREVYFYREQLNGHIEREYRPGQ